MGRNKSTGEEIVEYHPAFSHGYEYFRGFKLGTIKLNPLVRAYHYSLMMHWLNGLCRYRIALRRIMSARRYTRGIYLCSSNLNRGRTGTLAGIIRSRATSCASRYPHLPTHTPSMVADAVMHCVGQPGAEGIAKEGGPGREDGAGLFRA